MAIQYRWEVREIQCPEEKRVSSLFLTWSEEDERIVLCSVSCDNPRLRDLDNWECRWSCWEQIAAAD